ncbi:twin-arginine translocase TatA/TatE family subunit [Candidatus Cyanaurora vandensis]|uniref:Sec-independent protein translocase subunit TatA/TatB n=1 Tax=Candidatus Cyanaurora vandensis TaxID=2714958 RepID=UPI00257CAF01|nr:twin-arginine translocase TatA/TatE family subunit [Candidatus Cyanaurora vandensis]
MPSLGGTEILIILGVALLIFGPTKLPELGSSIGKALRSFKDGVKEAEKTDDAPADTNKSSTP